MPSNAVSLLLYVGLLLPGFAFTAARTRHRPIETRSAFFETTAAVFVSVLCDIVVLTAGVGIGHLLGLRRPIAVALRDPGAAYSADPVGLLLGTMVLLLVATLIGLLLGTYRAHLIGAKILREGGERRGSSWHQIFETAKPEGTQAILVQVDLMDGGAVQGVLSTFDRLGTDSGDRGLVLSGGIARRSSADEPFTEVVGFPTVAFTDRNIRSLQVTYLDQAWPPADPVADDAEGADPAA